LTKAGPGTLTLFGDNSSYNGSITVQAGTLVALANNALGSTAGGTTVDPGATLAFSGGVNYATAEAVR
jgi:autotransporter-associated beta strand protein